MLKSGLGRRHRKRQSLGENSLRLAKFRPTKLKRQTATPAPAEISRRPEPRRTLRGEQVTSRGENPRGRRSAGIENLKTNVIGVCDLVNPTKPLHAVRREPRSPFALGHCGVLRPRRSNPLRPLVTSSINRTWTRTLLGCLVFDYHYSTCSLPRLSQVPIGPLHHVDKRRDSRDELHPRAAA